MKIIIYLLFINVFVAQSVMANQCVGVEGFNWSSIPREWHTDDYMNENKGDLEIRSLDILGSEYLFDCPLFLKNGGKIEGNFYVQPTPVSEPPPNQPPTSTIQGVVSLVKGSEKGVCLYRGRTNGLAIICKIE